MNFEQKREASRAALVISHPGHELLVHGWLCETRPRVFVLADGAAAGEASQLSATRRVLADAGATAAELFGRCTDETIRRAMYRRDFAFFHAVAADLAAELVSLGVTQVVGDAAEGEWLTHDVLRAVVDAAVEIASDYLDAPIRNDEFSLLPGVPRAARELRMPSWSRTLSGDEVAAKLQAAREYELVPEEFAARVGRDGVLAISRERLDRVVPTTVAESSVPSSGLAVSSVTSSRLRIDGRATTAPSPRMREQVAPLVRSLQHLRVA